MATSGNTSWELTRDQIIKGAMQIVGALAKGQEPDTEDTLDGSRMLNGVLALCNADGMPLWKRTTETVTLISGQSAYTIPKAMKINDVFLQEISTGASYSLQWQNLQNFLDQFSDTPTTPATWTTDQLLQGTILKVWPTPDATTVTYKRLQIVYQKEFDGMFSASDTLDFPAYWTDPIMYQLAVRMAPVYGLPVADRTALLREASMYYDVAKNFTPEDSSLFFQIDRRR